MAITDLTGQKFGRYTVIGFDKKVGATYFWKCQCECGNLKSVQIANLRSGKSKSCGCLNRENSAKRLKEQATTHGLKNHTLYRTRTHMITRCYNPNQDGYQYYGGRGIKVCAEWLDKENGFMNFFHWAMSNGWKQGLTIDRIDSDGDYEPSNCRWATMKEQSQNRRNVKAKNAYAK